MPDSPSSTVWKITFQTPDDSRAVQAWLLSRVDLDRTWTDPVRTCPNGVEQVETFRHRLGDYFSSIRVLPDCQGDEESFGLVFDRHATAGRFWKDLMVNLLQEIELDPRTAKVTRDRLDYSEAHR
jgi:hypothetical protein